MAAPHGTPRNQQPPPSHEPRPAGPLYVLVARLERLRGTASPGPLTTRSATPWATTSAQPTRPTRATCTPSRAGPADSRSCSGPRPPPLPGPEFEPLLHAQQLVSAACTASGERLAMNAVAQGDPGHVPGAGAPGRRRGEGGGWRGGERV